MEHSSLYTQLKTYLEQDDTVVLLTVIGGPRELWGDHVLVRPDGSALYQHGEITTMVSDDDGWGQTVADVRAVLAQPEATASVITVVGPHGEPLECFRDVLAPPPHLVIIGGVHVGMSLCRLGKELGYKVTVIDPRPPFVTRERFPLADAIILAWPDDGLTQIKITAQTAIAVLTHDPKFDEPALKTSLATPAGYVGAIGSRKTRREHADRLREQGVSDASLARVHGPIGLDIGAKTPAEIALSIMAEIVAVRRGKAPLVASKRDGTPGAGGTR